MNPPHLSSFIFGLKSFTHKLEGHHPFAAHNPLMHATSLTVRSDHHHALHYQRSICHYRTLIKPVLCLLTVLARAIAAAKCIE